MIWLLMGAGALGAVVRLLLERGFQPRPVTGASPWAGWPIGILLANLIGTLLLGLVIGYARQHAIDLHPRSWSHREWDGRWAWLLATGLCGSLSTVSTLFVGVHALATRQPSRGICYLLGTLVLGVAAGMLGFTAGNLIG